MLSNIKSYANLINGKKVAQFVLITFVLSAVVAVVYRVAKQESNMVFTTVLSVVYMFMPLAGVLILHKWIRHEPLKDAIRIRFVFNRWVMIALLLPPLLSLATFGVSLLFPAVEYSPEMQGMFDRFKDVLPPEQLQTMKDQVDHLPLHPFWLSLFQGLLAGVSVNALVALGEELGWRGFLYKELSPLGFWPSTLSTGLIWGLWHAPLILQGHNYPQHPVAGVFMMILWCVLLSPLMGYVRYKAGTILAAAVFHGSINANYGLAILLIKGGNDLTVGLTGWAGMLVLAMANVALYFMLRKAPQSFK